MDPTLEQALPPVHRYDCVFRCVETQEVPPLPTTALRGALLWSLKSLACREPARSTCEACPRAASCGYPQLVEPRDEQGREQPSPFVMRPVVAVESDANVQLAKGDELRFELAFIGDTGLEHVSLVRAALAEVAARGIGLKEHGERPGLELESIARVTTPAPVIARDWEVRLTTPLRLTAHGDTAAALEPSVLWSGVVRRIRMLSELYGGSAPALPFEVPWALSEVQTSAIVIGRYSERQHKRMRWPGLVGRFRVSALEPHVEVVSRALSFVSQVQLGKGTQFGFGKLNYNG